VLCVVRVGDEIRVFNATCPHHYASLTNGVVHNLLEAGAPPALTVDRERWVITCPWHRWEYDLESGHALCDRRLRIKLYDSEVVDGRVVSRLAPKAASGDAPPLRA